MAFFQKVLYTSDSGSTLQIRIDNFTVGLQKTTPAAGISTAPGSAKAGGNRRTIGVHARGIRCVRTVGTGAAAKNFYTFVPILLPADFSDVTNNPGTTKTINGVAYAVSGRLGEKVR